MKLSEAISRIDKTATNDAGVYDSGIFEEVGVAFYDYVDLEEHGFKAYWLAKWYCTDTWVGSSIIFLDGEPMAISVKLARKSETTYEWISQEAFEKVRAKLFELSRPTDTVAKLANLDAEIGDGYRVSYGGQLLVKENLIVAETGERVNVIKTHDSYNEIKKWQIVTVEGPKGEREVHMDNLLVPWPITDEP